MIDREFKLRWEELANEALRVLKKIRELEAEFANLRERKKLGEPVKDLLKQRKVELKRLRKNEFKIYFERKNVLISKRGRFERVTCQNCGAVDSMKSMKDYGSISGVLYPMPPRPPIRYVCYKCGYEFSSFNRSKTIDIESLKKSLDEYKFSNLTKEDELALYIRELDLADKLRINRIKICFVLFLALFLPLIISFIVIIIN